ncbi:hypothetical protein FRB95_006800 [Tulasnella sp. JGI-2019a]|nr:hypothetical protein FRB95_006800 [Tulasnella sp. JGI-2019a]
MSAMNWFSEETDMDRLKRQLSQKDIRSANLQADIATKEKELEDVKLNLKEAIYKLQIEADRATKLQDVLEKKTAELQRERLNRQNVENAFDSAQEKQRITQRNLEQVQLELDNYALHNSGASEQQAQLIKERDTLKSRVKELEVNRSRALNLECEVANLRAENERLQQESSDKPSKHTFPTPGRTPARKTPGRPRSSSVSTDLRAVRLEAEVDELRSTNKELEQAKDTAETKLRRAMKDLLAMENGKMAAESIAEKEIAKLKDELDDRRLDIEDLRHQLQYTDLDHANNVNNEVERMRQEVGPLRTEVEQLKKHTTEQNAAAATYGQARDALIAESQLLRTRIAALETELAAAHTQSQRRASPEPGHAPELPRAGSDRNLRLAQRELSGAKRENAALREELKQLDDLLVEREEELADLRSGSSHDANGQDTLHATKITELEGRLGRATEERDEAVRNASAMTSASEQLSASRHENMALRSRVKELEIQLEETTNESADIRMTAAAAAEYEQQYRRSQDKVAEVQEQLRQATQELAAREGQAITLKEGATANLDLLKADLEQKEHDLDGVLQQLEVAREEARSAKQDLQVLKNERQPPNVLEVIQKALADANDQLEERESEVAELRGAFEGAQADIAAMEVAKRQVEDELEDVMAQAKRLAEMEIARPLPALKIDQGSQTPNTDETTPDNAEQLAHLLIAVSRLRTERDKLRERLHFLQLEIRFGANPSQIEKDEEMSRIRAEKEHLQAALKAIEDGLVAVIKTASPSRQLRLQQLQADHTDSARLIEFTQALVGEVELQLSVKQSESTASSSNPDVPKSHQLRYEVEDLKLRVLRREEQIGVHQHTIKRLEMNLKMAEEGLEEATAELEACQSENSNLIEDNTTVRQERDQVNRRLEEILDEKKGREESVVSHVSGIEQLQEQVRALEQSSAREVATLVEAVSKGAAEIKSLKAALHSTERIEAELEKARSDNEGAQRAMESIKTELASYESELQQLSDEKFDLATLYFELQQDHDALKEDVVRAKAEAQELTNLTEDNRRLRLTVKELHASIEEHSAARQNNDPLVEELQTLRTTNADLQKGHEDLSQRHTELNQRIEELTADLEEAQKKAVSSEEDKARLHEELVQMTGEQQSLTKELEEVRTSIDEAAAARVEFEQFYDEQHAAWVKREKELVDSTTLQAATLRGEKEANDVLMRSIETAAQRVREENAELVEKLAELQSTLDDHTRTSADELQAAHDQFKAQMAGKLAELEQENRHLRSELKQSEEKALEIESLREKLKEMEVDLERKGELLDESDDKLLEVLKERKKLQAKVDNLTRQRDHYRSLAPTTTPPPVQPSGSASSTNPVPIVSPPKLASLPMVPVTLAAAQAVEPEPVAEPTFLSAPVPASQRIFSRSSTEPVAQASAPVPSAPISGRRAALGSAAKPIEQAHGLLNIEPVQATTKSRPLGLRRPPPPSNILRGGSRPVLGPLTIQPSSAASVSRGRAATPDSNSNVEMTSSGSSSNLKKRVREDDDMPDDARRLPPMPIMTERQGSDSEGAGTPRTTTGQTRRALLRNPAVSSGGFAPSSRGATVAGSAKDVEDSQNRPPAEGSSGQGFMTRALLNLRPKSPSKPRRLNLPER